MNERLPIHEANQGPEEVHDNWLKENLSDINTAVLNLGMGTVAAVAEVTMELKGFQSFIANEISSLQLSPAVLEVAETIIDHPISEYALQHPMGVASACFLTVGAVMSYDVIRSFRDRNNESFV